MSIEWEEIERWEGDPILCRVCDPDDPGNCRGALCLPQAIIVKNRRTEKEIIERAKAAKRIPPTPQHVWDNFTKRFEERTTEAEFDRLWEELDYENLAENL